MFDKLVSATSCGARPLTTSKLEMERLKSEVDLSSLGPVEIGKAASRRTAAASMLGTRW